MVMKIKIITIIGLIAAFLGLFGGASAMTGDEYESQFGQGDNLGGVSEQGVTGSEVPVSGFDYGMPPADGLSGGPEGVPGDMTGGVPIEDSDMVQFDPVYPEQYPTEAPQAPEYKPEPGESAFFTSEQPRDAGTLVDQGFVDDATEVLGDVPGGNGLWIADGSGGERLVTLNVPSESYANQEIIPSVEGDLMVYYKYPSGYVKTVNMGYVHPHHRYWTWFYGDLPGTYEVWYTIGGVYFSNRVWYYVQDDWPWWYGGYTYNEYYWDWDPVVYRPHYYYYWPTFYEPVTYYYTPTVYSTHTTYVTSSIHSSWGGHKSHHGFFGL